ncbi:dienelactone hydrolase family protein [Acidovorax sp. JHL-9]|uniref:dienelactone hydrolase family protein n=1 Tax=Acidovorax sp. JHL-9 TaxID=1276756 RepID=UPI00047B8618|nr:dienelactone hydrolase family protein [Acidovorax sp. JHL-9]
MGPLARKALRAGTGGLRGLLVGMTVGLVASAALAQRTATFFEPTAAKGPVVVLVSGAGGIQAYQEFGPRLAALGFYTVLVDGRDIMIPPWESPAPQGHAHLAAVIQAALSAPQASSSKAMLVGFSLGGAGVLVHGAPMKDQVAAVVAYYPATAVMGQDLAAVTARWQAPVLVLAGEKDTYRNCCLVATMRALESAPKQVPFELVIYPQANHGVNLESYPLFFRSEDAEDAWNRTVAFLQKYRPAHDR